MDLLVIKQPRVHPNRDLYRRIKRLGDFALCVLALPFSLPIMALCVLAIRLDSPGPAIFVQERIGKGGRRFRMYKFRTMKYDLDLNNCKAYMKDYVRGRLTDTGNGRDVFKPVRADEVTRVGRILRKTSLDELPQIFNVLKGEMSIVGPRPNVLWEVDEYRPWHHERFEVLPGITGLAQVRGRSCIDFVSLVRFDIEYIEKQSLLLDLKIFWWTVRNTILGVGAK
jgi:lipopolysaccharide/colanic/teichoic acid biosynthesis glycosyltransferase